MAFWREARWQRGRGMETGMCPDTQLGTRGAARVLLPLLRLCQRAAAPEGSRSSGHPPQGSACQRPRAVLLSPPRDALTLPEAAPGSPMNPPVPRPLPTRTLPAVTSRRDGLGSSLPSRDLQEPQQSHRRPGGHGKHPFPGKKKTWGSPPGAILPCSSRIPSRLLCSPGSPRGRPVPPGHAFPSPGKGSGSAVSPLGTTRRRESAAEAFPRSQGREGSEERAPGTPGPRRRMRPRRTGDYTKIKRIPGSAADFQGLPSPEPKASRRPRLRGWIFYPA